jgi:hypothetical protein
MLLHFACTFHGQTLREPRAEAGQTGAQPRTGKGSMTAPLGFPTAPSPFPES